MINSVHLIGRLGKDPAISQVSNGAMAKFSLATTAKWKDKTTGEMKEQTEWHNLVAFGRLAEIIGQWVTKGMLIYVHGRLQTNKYDKDGVTLYFTQVVLDEMKMLSSRGEAAPSNLPQPEEDVPF